MSDKAGQVIKTKPLLCVDCLWHTSEESHIMIVYDVKNNPILEESSQDPSTSFKYDFEDGGS